MPVPLFDIETKGSALPPLEAPFPLIMPLITPFPLPARFKVRAGLLLLAVASLTRPAKVRVAVALLFVNVNEPVLAPSVPSLTVALKS